MFLDFRTPCELQLASYFSKRASRSLSRPTFTHNFLTIRRLPAFYITNDLFCVVDIPFQIQNPVLVLTGKLRLQTRLTIAFLYDIRCILKLKSKLLAATTLSNDSPATKDVSFYVKRIIKVTVFML